MLILQTAVAPPSAGSDSTYGCRFSRRADGLGHLAQDLVTVPGRVSSSLDLLLIHRLTVDVEFDAGGGNHDVELQRKEEEKNIYWNILCSETSC